MTAKVMLDKTPHPTDAQIREAMNGTLCRCMSYYRVQMAVKRAAKALADASPASEKEVVGMSISDQIPNQIEELLVTNRRGFLRSAGLLAVSFTADSPEAGHRRPMRRAHPRPRDPAPIPNPDFRQIDSWIVIHPDNTATFYVGKTDPAKAPEPVSAS